MAYPLSAGVYSKELDFTLSVPAVATTDGAIAGVFAWGPADDREIITSEEELVLRFGRPNANNFETFYTAANFLAYSNRLYVSRVSSANSFNAVAGNGTIANTQVLNAIDYDNTSIGANAYYVAKYTGALGNSLRISVCDSANAYSSTYTSNATVGYGASFTVNSNTATITVEDLSGANNTVANTAATTLLGKLQVGDYINAGNSTVGIQTIQIASLGTPAAANGISSISVGLKQRYYLAQNVTSNSITRYWEFYNSVDKAPDTSPYVTTRGGSKDEIHVVVQDEDGKFSGTPGTILEVWRNLSRATDAEGEQGGTIYYKNVLNTGSRYVWWGNHRPGAVANTAAAISGVDTVPLNLSFSGGTDLPTESSVSLSDLARAYDQFKPKDEVDISIIMTGKSVGGTSGEGLARYIIDNIAEIRKDVVVTISPELSDVVNAPSQELENLVAFRDAIGSSSYAILDSGYKKQYDRYNDVDRWIPLNGDIAGLIARTDDLRDPWFSPAGSTRGLIKNVVKLAYNPATQAARDILYKSDINPVVTFKGGRGTMLYGDKTLLGKSSAFSRINVRRLFIVLRKAIEIAAEGTLFELNNEFTRANFRNLVEPYLRDVQGRQGITAFRVVCDETNNTPEVIDRNEFIGSILVKPARTINFVMLNFAAVRTGVDFDEIVGQI